MKALARWLLMAGWTVFATLALTFVWLRWLAALFPFPESFWFWIFTHVPGFWDGEAGDDLELLIHLGLCFVVVVTGTWLVRRWMRGRRRRLAGLR